MWRTAVLLDWEVLAEAPSEIVDDRDLFLGAIAASYGAAMQFASAQFRADEEIVLDAAQKGCGSALGGATKELRANQDFVLQLLAEDPQAFAHAAPELQSSREFAIT